ncbi:hypothetical protein ScPMuIL_013178 [Solemya velum]
MTEIITIKRNFSNLVLEAHPWSLAQFIMWLDIKVSEYKVNGYMVLDDDKATKPRWLTDIGLSDVDESQEPYPVALLTSQPNKKHVIEANNCNVDPQNTDTVLNGEDDSQLNVIFPPSGGIDNFQGTEIPESVESQQNGESIGAEMNGMPKLEKEDDDVETCLHQGTFVVNDTGVCSDGNDSAESCDTAESELPILVKMDDFGTPSKMEPRIVICHDSSSCTRPSRKLPQADKARLIRRKPLTSGFHGGKQFVWGSKHDFSSFKPKGRRYNNYTQEQRQRIAELSMQMGPSLAARELSKELKLPISESTVRSIRTRYTVTRSKSSHSTLLSRKHTFGRRSSSPD